VKEINCEESAVIEVDHDTTDLIFSLGFRWDRQWVVVNAKGGWACTQRVEPKLLPTDAFSEGWEPTDSSYLGQNIGRT
ncbi:hypothetical protein MKW98_002412, partial [Papaver atlanticum]